MSDFAAFPKIARLARPVVITEKIDGTNAQIHIIPGTLLPEATPMPGVVLAHNKEADLFMFAGSRSRYLGLGKEDNFAFAHWVSGHADTLWGLGEGRHYGEWWGSGIQRGYGLPKGEKRFSLFNVNRWGSTRDVAKYPDDAPSCCHVVPVLGVGMFDTAAVDSVLRELAASGSVAAPGFMQPEGIVIYHTHANVLFKRTIVGDEAGKGQ